MNNFSKNLITTLLAVFVFIYFRDPIEAKIGPMWQNLKALVFYSSPCKEPIPYSLGSFDKRFNVDQKSFLAALAEAEAVWEKPSGKNLFAYKPGDTSYGNMKINLVYDYRQEATKTLNNLGIVVEDTKESYDKLKAKFLSQKSDYEKERTELNAEVTAFNVKTAQYEKDVTYWNSKGGAPGPEYEKLQQTRTELEKEQKILNEKQEILSNKADNINAMVVVINRLAAKLNLTVEKYNDVNQARGESFEEGVYYSEGMKRSIDIYEFENRQKLVRVLAHEFGHALGLEHVDDSKALMYAYNSGTSLTLTNADLKALEMKCGAARQ